MPVKLRHDWLLRHRVLSSAARYGCDPLSADEMNTTVAALVKQTDLAIVV